MTFAFSFILRNDPSIFILLISVLVFLFPIFIVRFCFHFVQLPGPVVQEVEDERRRKRKVAFEATYTKPLATINEKGVNGEALQWQQEKPEPIYVWPSFIANILC